MLKIGYTDKDIIDTIHNHKGSMNKDFFMKLRSKNNMWRLNEIAGTYWFNYKDKFKKDYNIKDIIRYFQEVGYSNEEISNNLKDNIKNKMLELDEQLVNNSLVKEDKNHINNKYLSKYLYLLTEHLNIDAELSTINRWPYNIELSETNLNINMAISQLVDIETNGVTNTTKLQVIDGNDLLRYAWNRVELNDSEGLRVFKLLYTYLNKSKEYLLNNHLNEENKYFDKVKLLINYPNFDSYPRILLTVCLGLGKALVGNGEIDKAKDIYKECITLFPMTNIVQYKHIHYWVGLNRILESALELYLISNDNEKKELKTKILEMFFRMREIDKSNNNLESTVEPLLIIYMMIAVLK